MKQGQRFNLWPRGSSRRFRSMSLNNRIRTLAVSAAFISAAGLGCGGDEGLTVDGIGGASELAETEDALTTCPYLLVGFGIPSTGKYGSTCNTWHSYSVDARNAPADSTCYLHLSTPEGTSHLWEISCYSYPYTTFFRAKDAADLSPAFPYGNYYLSVGFVRADGTVCRRGANFNLTRC